MDKLIRKMKTIHPEIAIMRGIFLFALVYFGIRLLYYLCVRFP